MAEPNVSRRAAALTVAGAIALVALAQTVMFLVVRHLLPTWPERGQFGDVFGAANAFFSGLAFAGLVYTIYLQHRQIDAQARQARGDAEAARQTMALTGESVRIAQAEFRATELPHRLTVAIALLEHVDRERARLTHLDDRGVAPPSAPRLLLNLEERASRLRAVIDAIYDIAIT